MLAQVNDYYMIPKVQGQISKKLKKNEKSTFFSVNMDLSWLYGKDKMSLVDSAQVLCNL